MLQKEIANKIAKDLKISERRARAYSEMFLERFQGEKRAITYILASYTTAGQVRISFIVNGRRMYFNLDADSPYRKEINRRKEKQ